MLGSQRWHFWWNEITNTTFTFALFAQFNITLDDFRFFFVFEAFQCKIPYCGCDGHICICYGWQCGLEIGFPWYESFCFHHQHIYLLSPSPPSSSSSSPYRISSPSSLYTPNRHHDLNILTSGATGLAPEFLGTISNLTTSQVGHHNHHHKRHHNHHHPWRMRGPMWFQGRDASFACSVRNLGGYRVNDLNQHVLFAGYMYKGGNTQKCSRITYFYSADQVLVLE